MTFTLRGLASLVTVLAISGAPAIVSACAALCATGMNHAAMSAGDAQASDCCAVPVSAPTGHAHHGAAAATARGDTGDAPILSGPRQAEAAKANASDHACCGAGRTLDGASAITARTDAGLLLAQAPVAASSLFAVTMPAPFRSASRPGAVTRSAARSPLVLRI